MTKAEESKPPTSGWTTWRECALCSRRYPRNTSGHSPCCDALLVTVIDEVAPWPPAGEGRVYGD